MNTATDGIIIGKAAAPVVLDRATPTGMGSSPARPAPGKTVTLQVMTEGFVARRAGVPGRCQGRPVRPLRRRRTLRKVRRSGAAARSRRVPAAGVSVVFWDVFGEQGHPIRATVSEMGPLLLARLLELNDTQEGAQRRLRRRPRPAAARPEGPARILQFISKRKELQGTYGNIAPTTVGAIQRKLLVVEREGGEAFFGEPALDLKDLQVDKAGQGIVGILAADRLINKPGSTPRFCSGCSPSCSRSCRRSAIATGRSWCCSSTRRTCCSTTRRRR